jgi:phosphoribosylglycinamide formyltransferase-1
VRTPAPLRLGVLASGRGSNLQALLDACAAPGFPARVALVIADRQAPALERARAAGVPALLVSPKDHADRAAHDAAVDAALREAGVGLVCLAGYLRVLGASFVRSWAGRILNVHPSLLPAFPGLYAQRQALDRGVKITGATVHVVDEGVDTGPIVLQAAVSVAEGDTEESLAARILVEEHRIYPEAVRLFAEGRARIAGRRVVVERA